MRILKPNQIPKREWTQTNKYLSLFKVEGKRGDKIMTEYQKMIFWHLVFRPENRLQIESSTQYGKSLTVALASIIISCIQDEIVAVIAPSDEKAKEIMRYYIEHLGDSIIFTRQLEKNTRLERLRQEESKNRIILRDGGGIYCLSTNERNVNKSIESAMGKGARITIMDEAGLIRDSTEATVFRMIAGKGEDAYYCKIGNPFYSQAPYSHFFQTSGVYPKIYINDERGLKEGRYTKEFLKEAKKKPLYDVLFACKFPERKEVDALGFRFLFSKELIDNAFIEERTEKNDEEAEKITGADIGRGGDTSAFVSRIKKEIWIENENDSRDTMVQVNVIKDLNSYRVNVDDIGIGGGVSDRARELDLPVNPINWASSAEDKERFANRKAENFFELFDYLNDGGKLVRDDRFYQLLEIKYKTNTSNKVIIEPKENLAKRGVKSPNIADATAFIFNKEVEIGIHFL